MKTAALLTPAITSRGYAAISGLEETPREDCAEVRVQMGWCVPVIGLYASIHLFCNLTLKENKLSLHSVLCRLISHLCIIS